MSDLQEFGEATYLLPRTGEMRVPGLVIATKELMNEVDIERPLEQVRNVATLPGIVGYSIAMPDMHWGYGFPIGGVAATDATHGVISPGGVGYDINCGVRLATVPLQFDELSEKQREKLLRTVYQKIPSGVGHGHKAAGLKEKDYDRLLQQGAAWSIEHGYGLKADLDNIESNGKIPEADPNMISSTAKERGSKQLGSIGSGNHFVEMGAIQQIFQPEIAESWGLKTGQVYILIHSGSRGFGHQICQDTLNHFIKKGFSKGLVDPQLVAAPLNSPEGKKYFASMAGAANFAFNNRQQIFHLVREAFKEVFGIKHEEIPLLYDVCHNIAKFETHEIEGRKRKVCVHRKGATRAFGPGSEELPPLFQKTGQPVFVPGDMGRASYIMAGLGNPLTFCSSSHGAGRARSRVQSMKEWKGRDPIKYMKDQGVIVMASSHRTIAEEMPDAYKNVDLVVEASEKAGLAKMVARLRPKLVVKG
jgi:tRNA-splicing ligase RtcB